MRPSQFTPYTCALDCLSSFLVERGLVVSSGDMLANHRDICFHAPPNHSIFGAIDADRFKHLVRRYLFVAYEFPVDDVAQVSSGIADGFGLFVFCNRFDGTDNLNHAIRIIGVEGDEYNLAVRFGPNETKTLEIQLI